MTLEDVQACIDHIVRFEISATSKEQYEKMARGLMDWIAPGGKQDLSWIEKNRLGTVVKAHGR